jgi:hypothetical protein
MIRDTVFGLEQFEGFYTCVVQKEGKVVCAATLRPMKV